MRKIVLVVLLAMPLGILAQKKEQKNAKLTFEVSGNCEMCQKRIEKAALSVKGVKMANWDIPTNIISIIHDATKAPLEMIHKAIAQVGHDTSLINAPESVYNALPMCCLYSRGENQ